MQQSDTETDTWLKAQVETNLKRVYGAPDRAPLPERFEKLLADLRRAEAERRQ